MTESVCNFANQHSKQLKVNEDINDSASHKRILETEKNTTSLHSYPINETAITTTTTVTAQKSDTHTARDSTISKLFTHSEYKVWLKNTCLFALLSMLVFKQFFYRSIHYHKKLYQVFSLCSKIGDDSNLLIIVFASVSFFPHLPAICLKLFLPLSLSFSLSLYPLSLFVYACVCVCVRAHRSHKNSNSLHRFSLIATLFANIFQSAKHV